MTPIQIQILAGRQTGRRVVLQQSPITFGREADNDLLIDMPYVSRHHGELRYDQETWYVLNQSPNGMRVGRKLCKDMPVPIKGSQTLTVGTDAILRVAPQPGAAVGEQTSEPDAEATGAAPAKKGLSKTWIGIGVYVLLLLVAVVFFATLSDNGDGGSRARGGKPVPLSNQDIQMEILAPLPPQSPDERKSSRFLQDALKRLSMIDIDKRNLYEAHDSFRKAIAFSRERRLPTPLDERRFEYVQRQLIDEVTQRYRNAVDLYEGGLANEAYDQFNELADMYPAMRNNSEIARSIERYETAAAAERSS